MRAVTPYVIGCLAMLAAGGCRTATRIKEVPRVDLEVDNSGGNRGYLYGTPPPASAWKTTRQIIETDVEVPSLYIPKKGAGGPMSLEGGAPTEAAAGEASTEAAPETAAPVGPHDIYVVKKGESLWTISAKPEIYGKATHWRRIFDANRNILKSPDRVRAGMKLKIPRGEADSGTTYGEEGTTSKK